MFHVQGLEDFLNASITEMKNKKIGIRQIYVHCNEFIYALKKTIEDLNTVTGMVYVSIDQYGSHGPQVAIGTLEMWPV